MKRIVILDPISEDAARRLEQETGWKVEQHVGLPAAEIPAAVENADVLIVRSSTKVTAEVIAAAKRLKVIGRAGIGVDNIDMEAASERDIRVVNTPGATTSSVAELALGSMLSLARWIHAGDASVRRGEWDRSGFQGMELRGKLLGLVGFGRIGREVAKLAQAFGMRVAATDPYLSATHAAGIQLQTLDEVLKRSDFVSLHLPLDDDSRGILSRERLETMKRGAFLLNLGRGGLVDEEALAEPPGASIDRLRRHPRTLLLPHLGAQTREGQIRVGMELVEGVGKAVKKIMGARAAALAASKEEAEAQAAAEAAAPAGEGAKTEVGGE
jgi:D-3-phosphoglycerate dehydrogenase